MCIYIYMYIYYIYIHIYIVYIHIYCIYTYILYIWTVIKFMFQTTNQFLSFLQPRLGETTIELVRPHLWGQLVVLTLSQSGLG